MGDPTRIDMFAARAAREEGRKPFAYNDATGHRITCQPNGNLSIGIGLNLETGLDSEEITWLFSHRAGKVDRALNEYQWYRDLDEPRGSVFLDLGFNNGVAGLLHYTTVIHFASFKQWPQCSAQLLNTKAGMSKLRPRYEALAHIILTGVSS